MIVMTLTIMMTERVGERAARRGGMMLTLMMIMIMFKKAGKVMVSVIMMIMVTAVLEKDLRGSKVLERYI